MGCTTSTEIMARSESNRVIPTSAEAEIHPPHSTPLDKGGFLIKTAIGNVQFGIPPETVKDSMSLGTQVPEYYIVPKEKFDWSDGINLMEFEFPVYYNFFLRKQNKTKLICDEETRERIRVIFQETLLGPATFEDFQEDFADRYEAIPDFEKELAHFAKNPFNPQQVLSIELFIEFLVFDSRGEVRIRKDVEHPEHKKMESHELRIVRKGDKFTLFEDGQLLTEFDDYVQMNRSQYFVYKNIEQGAQDTFTPPAFGLTMLGNSHGFDCAGSTSGFIVWINHKGVMVDPPPYSSKALRDQNIPPNLIEKIIISHCHADHDAGAFHKIIEATPVEFLSTPTILKSFVRKYAAISGLSTEDIKALFQYRSVAIGHPTLICGARFTFEYSFHSIPALNFSIEFQGKKFFFSGDTFYNPERLEELWQQGLFSQARFESLAKRDFSEYDVIFHEAGIPPIHTPASIFKDWPDSTLEKLYLYHIAEKDLAQNPKLKAMKNGLQGTIVIIQEDTEVDENISTLDLLVSMEIIRWVPFNRILEIIQCFREKKYPKGSLIVQAQTTGDTFFIIKKGLCRVYSESTTDFGSFSKRYFPGDYFGEAAIIGNGLRLANVSAVTDVTLLEINKYDFKWIFSYQPDSAVARLGPLELIKNLSEIRKAKLAEFINENKTIARMTESQKSFLNMYIKEKQVKSKDVLWRVGEIPQFCFLIKSGKYQMRAPFNSVPKQFALIPSTLVGDFPSLCNQEEKSASEVICTEDGVILTISRDNFKLFLKQYPGFYILCKSKFVIY